jgi:phosphoribosyl-ATP pyrophosphohydrolase
VVQSPHFEAGTGSVTDDVLQRLAALVHSRRGAAAAKSYTKELLDGGPERCARKLGEEAIETVVAALGTDKGALTQEAADLLYHLLVLLESREVGLDAVLSELESRMGTSGHREKASRQVPQ